VRKHLGFEGRQKLVGLSFIAPWAIGFAVFTAFPLLYCLYMALNKVSFVTDRLEMEWLGLANFKKALLEDAEIPNKLFQTLEQSLSP
jgi:ABC-type sugar transport system permease subunit